MSTSCAGDLYTNVVRTQCTATQGRFILSNLRTIDSRDIRHYGMHSLPRQEDMVPIAVQPHETLPQELFSKQSIDDYWGTASILIVVIIGLGSRKLRIAHINTATKT